MNLEHSNKYKGFACIIRMIVFDIETSGLNIGECGIWQIGAIDMNNPDNYFLEEARIDDEDQVEIEAMNVTGKSEGDLRDKNKQSQKQLILNFLEWIRTCREKISLGQNVGFDIMFLQTKSMKYKIIDIFREVMGARTMDLHTIAQMKYHEIYGKYKLREEGLSDMNLKNTLDFCGIPDERRVVENEEIKEEGKPHDALDDCKLEAECFSRIVYGKNLFTEYSQYKIPEHLKR